MRKRWNRGRIKTKEKNPKQNAHLEAQFPLVGWEDSCRRYKTQRKTGRSRGWSPSAFCFQRSDEGREGVKFEGAVCTGIDSLSGVPPSLQIDLKIVDNHTDGSALGTSDAALRTRARANTFRPQSLHGVGGFYFRHFMGGGWGSSPRGRLPGS